MSQPTVSVVIPCYNAESFVAHAVESVWAQTLSAYEIICVDDGSTDGTLGALRSLERRSPVPFRILTGANGGPSVARNRGTTVAHGDYIQYLDADDLLQPDKLLHQIALCERASYPDLVVASYTETPFDSKEEARAAVIQLDRDIWCGLLKGGGRAGITSANLWRRTAVLCVGGWDEELRTSEDPDLVFRMMQAGCSILRDPVPKTSHRSRPDSQWSHDPDASTLGWLALRERIAQHLRETGELTDERLWCLSQAAFLKMRSVYDKHPEFARRLHRNIIAPRYRPSRDRNGWIYRTLYRLLGFEYTERLARGLKR